MNFKKLILFVIFITFYISNIFSTTTAFAEKTSVYTMGIAGPTVISTLPGNDSVGNRLDQEVTLFFNEAIQAGDKFNFIVLYEKTINKQISFKATISGNVLSIKSDINFKINTKYTIEIPDGCIKDGAGNNNLSYSFVFTTGQTPPELEWTKSFGKTNYPDFPSQLIRTKDDCYIFAGAGSGRNTVSAHIFKISITGDVIWEKFFNNIEYVYYIIQTKDGGYLLSGLEASNGVIGYPLLVRLDSEGNMLWKKTYCNQNVSCISLKEASNGDFIAINGASPQYVRVDKNGNILESKTIFSYIQDAIATVDDGFIFCNDGSINSNTQTNYLYINKTNELGTQIWEQHFSIGSFCKGCIVREINNGNYIVLAFKGNTANMALQDGEYWLIEVDKNGSELWRNFVGYGSNYCVNYGNETGIYSLQQTQDGGFAILVGDSKIDAYGNQINPKRMILYKTDSLGNKLWEKSFAGATGGEADAVGRSILSTTDKGFIIPGANNGASCGKYYLIKLFPENVFIKSSTYNLNNEEFKITNIPFETSAPDFLSNIGTMNGSSVKLYQNDGITPISSENIITGMKLIVSPDNGYPAQVYSIYVNKNTDAKITSSKYTVYSTFVSVPFGTTVSDFNQNVSYPFGSTNNIYKGEGLEKVTEGRLQTGMILKVKSEDGNIENVYRIDVNKNTDTTLTSTKYAIDNVGLIISNIPYGELVQDFLSNITPAELASIKICNEGGNIEITSGKLTKGMILEVTADDKVTINKYKITLNNNTDTSISTFMYAIDNTEMCIKNIPYNTTIEAFISNFTKADGAILKVYDKSEKEVNAGKLVKGMKLVSIAEDGINKEVYTLEINKNSDVSISSTKYIVDKKAYKIKNIPKKTQITTLKKNIKLAYGATLAIYQSNGKTKVISGYITSGMKLSVTSEDGKNKKSYTLVVK